MFLLLLRLFILNLFFKNNKEFFKCLTRKHDFKSKAFVLLFLNKFLLLLCPFYFRIFRFYKLFKMVFILVSGDLLYGQAPLYFTSLSCYSRHDPVQFGSSTIINNVLMWFIRHKTCMAWIQLLSLTFSISRAFLIKHSSVVEMNR